ncbi:methyltransferase domain-containing protein [bacterium]|nr:methyltransferase domain-containing protein [bacterium]
MRPAHSLKQAEAEAAPEADRSRGIVCPRCRDGFPADPFVVSGITCLRCGFEAKDAAGFPDLRTSSDRYLSRNQETRKAVKLSAREPAESLEGLARHYYRMTADVSRAREDRFVAHILDAQGRGSALLARIPAEGPVLEVGCGTGGFVAAAALAGREIVGVDIAARWLVVARKRLESCTGGYAVRNRHHEATSRFPCPRLLAACAESLPFADASFSVVVADSLLEHVADPAAALAEMLRVLRPGGSIVLWFPNRRWLGPDPHVGLIGLPLLPKRLASRYVKARRGPIFWPPCRTGAEWADLAQAVMPGLESTIRAADLRAWPKADRSMRARSARLLGRLSTVPGFSAVLRHFGPIGEVVLRKPEVDFDRFTQFRVSTGAAR